MLKYTIEPNKKTAHDAAVLSSFIAISYMMCDMYREQQDSKSAEQLITAAVKASRVYGFIGLNSLSGECLQPQQSTCIRCYHPKPSVLSHIGREM